MILPDLNLVVYAHNRDAPDDDAARAWWERLLNGTEPVAFPWAVVLGFIRLMTLAIEHQCESHSNDNDFARFPGLRWRNPL